MFHWALGPIQEFSRNFSGFQVELKVVLWDFRDVLGFSSGFRVFHENSGVSEVYLWFLEVQKRSKCLAALKGVAGVIQEVSGGFRGTQERSSEIPGVF